MRYVRSIAREPHALGSPGHARVRTYLIGVLRDLGLQPQVQEATVAGLLTNAQSVSPSGALFGAASRIGYAYNVIARLKGRQPGKALLLVAHYDSQPNTLGAADDGAGVAAILETSRALRQANPLQHDVILLFTDGEENGLFGAKAFLRHPWAKDVGFILNLEARGNRGPSLTFEMSSQNGWIVEQLAKAAPYPMATSLMYEVYQKLPNVTDFTIFREAGYAGINSAFMDGFVHYHKLSDSPDNLSQNSLQHHGDNLLALTRHFGNISLDQVKAPDKVFFNGVGTWLVHYPTGLNGFWLVLLTGALVATCIVGFQQQALTVGQVVGSLALYLVILLFIGSYDLLITIGVHRALPLTHVFNGTYGSNQFFIAYTLLTVGAFGLLIRLGLRWLRPVSLIMGAYVLIYALILVQFFLLPTSMYLLLFPLLGALVGLLMVLIQTRRAAWQPAYALILLITALPTLFLLMPTVNLLFITFDLQLPAASMLLLGLALALLLPLWLFIERGLQWRIKSNQTVSHWNLPILPLASLLLGMVITVLAIINEVPTARQPLHSQISYFLNADTKQAVWGSYGLLPIDDWNQQFFSRATVGKLTEIHPDAQPPDGRVYLKSPAIAIPDAPPVAEIRSDIASDSIRQLTLELSSPRGAANLEIVLFPQRAADIRSIQVNGESLPLQVQPTTVGPAYDILFLGLPVTKKLTLTIDLMVNSSLRLLLADQSIGLPSALVKKPRPAYVVPEQGRISNLTIISRTHQF